MYARKSTDVLKKNAHYQNKQTIGRSVHLSSLSSYFVHSIIIVFRAKILYLTMIVPVVATIAFCFIGVTY